MRPRMLGLMGVVVLVFLMTVPLSAAPSVDPVLAQQVAAAPLSWTPVVITFDHTPGSMDFIALNSLGISGGVVLSQLPMILTEINQTQFNALSSQPGIRSLYANQTFSVFTNVSRRFIGVFDLWADQDVSSLNQGMPVSGQGIGVAYVDTGVDATHPDLQLGQNVAQNVLFPLAEVPANPPSGFVPPVAIENQPMTDAEGGHGTFGSEIVAGTGQASGDFYGGVAPGSHLVMLVAGNDVGLSTFAIVQAYDYALTHQFQYNIRVCNNSFGTTLASHPYNPFDPINTATRMMHDRNITVVFAAGNSGDTAGAINPFSVAPWVISVAAGEKAALGQPASFSSRGEDNGTGTDTAGMPANPLAPPNLRPDLIAPGVNIKSARSKGPGITNFAGTIPVFVGANDLTTIAPAFLPFYTTSNGTSFATPHVTGVVALMMQANPLLTPDDVVTILRSVATPMPYPERVVGAGYLDAHNAVRVAMNLATVAHPANLIPQPGDPQIVDPSDDQFGTT
ncbi:MAG: S8 family serine peptidase, partial [Acidobacteriia bacterium]|nr:S8 family serine peptidase [Terriglobia bacterium]